MAGRNEGVQGGEKAVCVKRGFMSLSAPLPRLIHLQSCTSNFMSADVFVLMEPGKVGRMCVCVCVVALLFDSL